MTYAITPLKVPLYLIHQAYLRLIDLSGRNVWLVGCNTIWFLVVALAITLPGIWLVKKLSPRIGLMGLVVAYLLGNLGFFLWRYLAVTLVLPNTVFVAVVVMLAVLTAWRGRAWSDLLATLSTVRRRHLWLLLFFLLLSLAWTYGTITTGMLDKQGDVVLSMWLGGERLMMTGHATTIYEQLPPIHPYWQNVYLQYHYFGTVLQTAYHAFGGNPLLINFLLLPTAIALSVASIMYMLTYALVGKKWAAWGSPVVFFLWDTWGYFFPAVYRYGATRWWVTVFTDHKHAYINGNSHAFAALFISLALVLFWLSSAEKGWRRGALLVLGGMAGGVLILMKAQAFIAFVAAVLLYALLEILWSLFGKKSKLLDTLSTLGWLFVGGLLTGLPLLWSNASQLIQPNEQNVLFSPLSHPLGALDYVPAVHNHIESLAPGITAQIRFWTEYQLPSELVRYFWLISIGFMLVAISAKVIGLGAPLFNRQLDERRRSLLLMLWSLAVTAIGGTLLLWLTLGNQWQFLFSAFLPLSILTVYVLSQIRGGKWLFIILTLISLPTGLGVLADSPIDRTLPSNEIANVTQIRQLRSRLDSCFLALPPNTEGPATGVDLHNQVREIMYPFFAHCRVNAALGPKPILNFALKDTDRIYKVLLTDLQAVTDSATLGAYLDKYQPRWLWLAPHNRYGATPENMAAFGYQLVPNTSQDGGQILERH